MKFYLLMKQRGEGCDYTIGCARNWMSFDAPTVEDAERIAAEEIGNEYTDERELEEATLVAIDETVSIDLVSIYREVNRVRAERVEKQRQDEKRKQYEALKKEFGDKS